MAGRKIGKCSVPGCDRKHYGRGWCQCHWKRWKAHGDVDAARPIRVRASVESRFLSKVTIADNGCWLWTGSLDRAGYGRLSIDNYPALAHRFSFEHFNGAIPTGLDIDHMCHNADETCGGGPDCMHRRCVNPDHLRPATRLENVRRGRGGLFWSNKTHCPQGHPYAGANLYTEKDGKRRCRICQSATGRRYRLRKKATKKQ